MTASSHASYRHASSERHRSKSRTPWRLVVSGVVITIATWSTGYVRTAAIRDASGARPVRAGFYRDGTYTGWGDSRHGRILATVVIRRGRISSAEITTCRMRYPCSMIAMLPGQVVTRQGADVDLVSGATQSAEAFSMAVGRALEHAIRER